jgi:hypothetical protein
LSLLKSLILSGLFLALSAGALEALELMDVSDLRQYLWKNRLLVVFSPGAEVPAYQALSQELDHDPSGVRERDLLVFLVLEHGPSFLGLQEMPSRGAEDLRRRFGVTQEAFTVVLVGKDGTLKLKREGPTALAEIFALIDSMPMRQREMKGN